MIWKREADMSFTPKRKSHLAIISVLIVSFLAVPMSGCKGLQKKTSGYIWERAFRNEDLSLVDASILNENNIWAVDWVDIGIRRSEILYSNGKALEKKFSAERFMLNDIYALNKDHVWAVGGQVAEDKDSADIYFFDGINWSLDLTVEGIAGFISIFPLDENHVWATAKCIYFFNGSEWSKQLESEERFQALYSTRDSAAWAVSETGTIYHFDGSSWSEQQQLRFPNDRVFISQARLCALDESHVWAALFDTESEITRIFFFDGSSWEEQLALPRTLVVTGIHALDEKHVWASCGSAFDKQCPILFFDGREWSIQEECDESLVGIKALGEDDILAVGESGSIYKGRKD